MTGINYYPMRSVAFDAAGDSGLIYLSPAQPSEPKYKQPAEAIDFFIEDEDDLEFALWALAVCRAEED